MSGEKDQAGFIRIPPNLRDRWLRRAHLEGVDPDDAAAVQLERALRRDGALMGEDHADQTNDPEPQPDTEPPS